VSNFFDDSLILVPGHPVGQGVSAENQVLCLFTGCFVLHTYSPSL